MTLGQRVAVMKDGALQQVAPPMEVYRRPANAFVAGFVGSPAMNFLRSTAIGGGEDARLEGEGFAVRGLQEGAAGEGSPAGPGLEGEADILLGIRPHDVELVAPGEGDARARVDVVEPLGSEILLHLDLEGRKGAEEFRAIVPPEFSPGVDAAVGVRLRRDRLHLFDAGSGARLG